MSRLNVLYDKLFISRANDLQAGWTGNELAEQASTRMNGQTKQAEWVAEEIAEWIK